jgi:hypothetical protein
MGQYHVLANLDRKEFVDPNGLGLGIKQWEHIGDYNGTLADAMYILCMASPYRGGGDLPLTEASGRWAGDRAVIVGDYTVDDDLPNVKDAGQLYFDIGGDDPTWINITEMVAEAFYRIFGIERNVDRWNVIIDAIANLQKGNNDTSK